MVNSAVADIVAPAVAADDPNRLVNEVTLISENFLDAFIFGGFDEFDELRSNDRSPLEVRVPHWL